MPDATPPTDPGEGATNGEAAAEAVMAPEAFEPASHAEQLAREIVTAEEQQRTILEEAVADGEEAGRTICGRKEDAREPIARAFDGLVLPGCPIGHRGLMHGGGGHDLHAPRNSLLDMANVLFGGASVIATIGTRRSDLFLAPTEDQLAAAQDVFENAIGFEVDSFEDFVEAREAGRIRNPIQAGQRIREELDPLFVSVETPHPDVELTTRDSPAATVGAMAIGSIGMTAQRLDRIVQNLWTVLNAVFSFDFASAEVNFAQLLASEIASALVLVFFLRVFGGRPTAMVAGSA